MVLKKFDISEQLPSGSRFPNKRSVVTTTPYLELTRSPLESGNDVLAPNFGKSCVKDNKVRKGRNPAFGRDITLPTGRVATFKRSGKLREKVDQKR